MVCGLEDVGFWRNGLGFRVWVLLMKFPAVWRGMARNASMPQGTEALAHQKGMQGSGSVMAYVEPQISKPLPSPYLV